VSRLWSAMPRRHHDEHLGQRSVVLNDPALITLQQ
jgi:hypothetical protein